MLRRKKGAKKTIADAMVKLAEGTGLEPAGLLRLTRVPGELLSHSVNPLYRVIWNVFKASLARRLYYYTYMHLILQYIFDGAEMMARALRI